MISLPGGKSSAKYIDNSAGAVHVRFGERNVVELTPLVLQLLQVGVIRVFIYRAASKAFFSACPYCGQLKTLDFLKVTVGLPPLTARVSDVAGVVGS